MQNPTEMIENPSQQKTAEAHSTDSRANASGCPLRSEDLKRAGFSVELMGSHVQQTVQKLSRAAQVSHCRKFLYLGHATVDAMLDAGDLVTVVGRQEDDGLRDLVR